MNAAFNKAIYRSYTASLGLCFNSTNQSTTFRPVIAALCAMTNKISCRILELTKAECYRQAYKEGLRALEADPNNSQILESLYELSGALRSKAIDFSSRKANYASISKEEVLLEKVNELTGQDMYGNFI